jgi:hypothetical protein
MTYRKVVLTLPAVLAISLATMLGATMLPLGASAAETPARKVRTLKDPRIVESSGLALSL